VSLLRTSAVFVGPIDYASQQECSGGGRNSGAAAGLNLRGMCEGEILHVTYTERGERIRIISARQAARHEQDDHDRENAR
jgi:uncharacterized DUF497 family protein